MSVTWNSLLWVMEFVICKTCKANVIRGETTMKTLGTWNLTRHLEHCEPAENVQFEEADKSKWWH